MIEPETVTMLLDQLPSKLREELEGGMKASLHARFTPMVHSMMHEMTNDMLKWGITLNQIEVMFQDGVKAVMTKHGEPA
jgi:hypothetical protein